MSDTEKSDGVTVQNPADTPLRDGPGSVRARIEDARKQCDLALDQLEGHERYNLCAELAEVDKTLEEVLEAVVKLDNCDDDTPDTPPVRTDGGQPLERPPSKADQAKERARDELTRQELTNLVYGLPNVCEVLVDGEDEDWRPTMITVGFKDWRATGDVGTIMRRQGWRFVDATFQHQRVTFVEPGVGAEEVSLR